MVNPGTQNPSSSTKDVFLSFRGVDTRAGFTTTLYNMLVDNKVETFMDAENLPIGEEISDTLLQAIDNAKAAIIVFSVNYASSSWCLDELAKIIECKDRKDRVGMKVIPVFYKIEPTTIRHQTGPYKTAIDVHKEKNDPERIMKWRSALISAANLSGLGTDDFKNEFQLMRRIVDVASKALVRWEEAFKKQQARSQGHSVNNYVQSREKKVSESVNSVALDWGDVAAAAAKVAKVGKVGINDKNSKDKRNDDMAAAVAVAASPKLGIGKAGSTSSSGEDSDELVIFNDSSEYCDLKESLKDILDSLDGQSFGMIGVYSFGNEVSVAVRRLQGVKLSKKKFKKKMDAIEELQHENLVPLRAYYFSTDEKLLYYDNIKEGSLYDDLRETRLNFEMRLDIALGAARGIEHIHSKGVHMSHGNIKSSNILLGESCACVSDYCLADLVDPKSSPSTKVSQQADVYSFGVVLIELVSGKDPARPLWEKEEAGLPKWVASIIEDEWIHRVIHFELARDSDSDSEEKMLQLLRLAVACTASRPSKRPTMSEVTRRIKEIIKY